MAKERYNPDHVEPHWRQYWEGVRLFNCDLDDAAPKFYCLTMFPYPSAGLHVGHGRNYILGDVVARYKTMQGFNVLHPMGWDAFGLPAENAAIRRNLHPRDSVANNVEVMKRQFDMLGIGYDWEREINTSEPGYYRWTQWVFLQLYKRGLAYRRDAPVNWCPSCQTGLANEEVVQGLCERCDTEVVTKDLPQWFFKITDYSQRLLDDLELLEKWPERVRTMQANWIGRSEGALVYFKVAGPEGAAHAGELMPCFTTRPDTLWGVTFMSLAPEHPVIPDLVAGTEYEEEVLGFAGDAVEQNQAARGSEAVEKEGVFTGRYVINPVNGEQVPLWVANYALMEYGTGAVMAVPAHDQRDFEFAKKYDLDIRVVIQPPEGAISAETMTEAYEFAGTMTDSGPFDGTAVPAGIHQVVEHLAANDMGEADVNFRLRDWLISRQRYWVAPIPVVHCPACGTVPVPEDQLPVVLPDAVDFTPRGKSPLAFVEEFVKTTCPECGADAERETDTIAQWLCSCWYFLRYITPGDAEKPYDRGDVDKWLPVDLYIGGVEHAVLHLLYTRFVVKVLADAGDVDFAEPFTALFTQGMICKQSYICTRCSKIVSDDKDVREPCTCYVGAGLRERIEQGIEVTATLEKMSKSKGNGVPVEDAIPTYGADTVRLYTLAIGPPERDAEWQDSGIVGYSRFLNRLWDLIVAHEAGFKAVPTSPPDVAALSGDWERVFRLVHATIKHVTDDIEGRWHFNTAIASVISLVNEVLRLPLLGAYVGTETEEELRNFAVFRFAMSRTVQLLAPFVPHVAEELWTRLGNPPSIFRQGWPEYDAELAKADEVELPVQVNGKVRDRLVVPRDEAADVVKEQALALPNVRRYLEGKELKKIVVVPNRIVNIVAR